MSLLRDASTDRRRSLPLNSNRKLVGPLLLLLTTCLFASSAQAKYGGGSGTELDPYIVSEPNHLNQLHNEPNDFNKSFLMTADVNMIGYTFNSAVIAPDTDIYHAWYTGTPFAGCFNGDGHVITNLSIVQNTYYLDHVGLFGEIDGGTVENLGVVNISITLGDDSHAAGGLASTNKGTIRNCYTSGKIEDGLSSLGGLVGYNTGLIIDSFSTCLVTGRYDCKFLGGLVGNNVGRVERCYATGSVFGEESALIIGGLVGNNPGDVIYCYSTGSVIGWLNSYDVGGLVGRNNGIVCYSYSDAYMGGTSTTENVGGLAGSNYYGKILNSYSSARIYDYGMNPAYVGGLTAKNYFSEIRNCFWNTSTCFVSHGVGSDTEGIIVNLEGITTEQMRQQETFTDGPAHWDFVEEVNNGRSDDWSMPESVGFPILWWQLDPWPQLPTFPGGDGSKENPFLITDSNALNSIGHNSRLMDKHFKIMQNIDCNGIEYLVIGSEILPFCGVFDGQGHVVQNLVLNSSESEFVGFFPYLGENSIIQNFGLENVQIETGTADSVGAMAGILDNGGIIKRCFAEGSLTVGDDSAYVGGFVGLNNGTIECSFTDMSVIAGDDTYALGGFSGRSFSEITNCYSLGSVSCGSEGRNIGGLVGENIASAEVSLSFCFSSTALNVGMSSTSVGGFLGANLEYSLLDAGPCFWDVEVSGYTDGVGNLEPDPDGVTGLTTVEMMQQDSFTGWDFVDEIDNGVQDIWRLCNEGAEYPQLNWQFLLGDFVCPDGVEINDLAALIEQWLLEKLSADVAPDGGDGFVDFLDWAVFANGWQSTTDINDLAVFIEQWLQFSAYCADIAPAPDGDGIVNMLDFAVLADNWLVGVE